jgi:4-amino-4-deoxy-L-arabinose transferase-like glycosyltransferase
MTDSAPLPSRRAWILAIALALFLGLFMQGSRGLFEPDEGTYSTAGRLMSETGDWLIPRLNGEPFLDKPPLIYWGMVASIKVLGPTAFAIRFFHALWFAGTALLVGLFAARVWGSRAGPRGIIIYATMLGPFLAASVLTPDTLLAFWTTALLYAYWRYTTAEERRQQLLWCLALGLALAGGILSKGPAAFIFLPALAVHRLRWHGWKATVRPELIATGFLGIGLGMIWYLMIGVALPGTLAFWWDLQIAGRLWGEQYDRAPEWWKGFEIYLPFLLVGALPYTFGLWGDLRRASRAFLARMSKGTVEERAESLLFLAVVLPLAILFMASSKLTLYSLPILAPRAMLVVGRLRLRALAPKRLAVGVAVLLALKAFGGYAPSLRDGERTANHMRSVGVASDSTILVIDTKFNVLGAYGFDNVRHVLLSSNPGVAWQAVFFVTPSMLELEYLEEEIAQAGRVFIVTRTGSLSRLYALLDGSEIEAEVLPSFYRNGILVRLSSRSPVP